MKCIKSRTVLLERIKIEWDTFFLRYKINRSKMFSHLSLFYWVYICNVRKYKKQYKKKQNNKKQYKKPKIINKLNLLE